MLAAKGESRRSLKGKHPMQWKQIIYNALRGMMIGNLVGVAVACYVIFPGRETCGLVGVFITAPLGFVFGALFAVGRSTRRRDLRFGLVILAVVAIALVALPVQGARLWVIR
jgi:hypothetical protein